MRRRSILTKRAGHGLRIIACWLPIKSPWLNPIEPTWGHGKRKVVEAAGLLTASDLAERVCSAFDCDYLQHLTVLKDVA